MAGGRGEPGERAWADAGAAPRGASPSGAALLRALRLLSLAPRAPRPARLRAELEAALAVEAAAPPGLRPRDEAGRPGGLLLLDPLSTAILPDLHARHGYLLKALAWRPAPRGPRLIELLAAGQARLLCLGDAFHSEGPRGRARWLRAYDEYRLAGDFGPAMEAEMADSLTTVRMILRLLAAYPGRFFYLKGNHDNILNEEGRGDHPFRKFAAEGAMVAAWFESRYGRALQEALRGFELGLPLLARGEGWAASHAEPAFALGPEELLAYRERPEVAEALTWTANEEAARGSVAESLSRLGLPEGSLWFAGHRPVEGRYALRAEGRFVQFHDPDSERLLWLLPGRVPDPERDLVSL